MSTREHAVGTSQALPLALAALITLAGAGPCAASESGSRLSDKPIPLQLDKVPARPKPLLELGPPFLGTGNLPQGIELPTGAVWQPQFLAWGTLRSAVQTFESNNRRTSEWANRLDLFGQLSLSGTERVLVGLRPLDQNGRFSGYNFEPSANNGWRNESNLDISQLFFEGDLGQIFPNATENNLRALDYGFSVGRQPIFFQEGMLINDIIDSVGVVRNNIHLPGASNLRATFLYSWGHINRNDNQRDDSAKLYAIFTEADFPCCTVDLDVAYVDGDHPGVYGGISSVQRFGRFNASLRALISHAEKADSPQASDGELLFAEFSFTPHGTQDNVYLDGFWGIDRFSSAARGPATGGPLGRTGILFASVGLGRYGAALGNQPDNAYGAALGYQMFLAGGLKQWIFEAGFRDETRGPEQGAAAVGAQYQQAFGHHLVMVLGGFIGGRNNQSGSNNGIRAEALYKF